MNKRADNIKAAVEGKQYKYIGRHIGHYTCLCGGDGDYGLEFEELGTGKRVVLGDKCAFKYLPADCLPKLKKGRRTSFGPEFLNAWAGPVRKET